MARSNFGGGVGETTGAVFEFAGKQLFDFEATTLDVWAAETGGTQYTDLLLNGVAVSAIPVPSTGQIPVFQGPDGVTTVWVSAGGGERVRLDALADIVASVTAERVAAETARAGAEAVGTTNDAVIAGRINDSASATRTALKARLAEYHVQDYATPQAAIDAAQAAGVPAVVKFGRATYAPATPWAVTASNILLDFGTATITSAVSASTVTFTGTSGAPLQQVGLRGGHFNLNGASLVAVAFTYCDSPRVEGVSATTGSTNASAAASLTNCTNPVIRGVRAHATGVGVSLVATTGASISGCVLTSMKRDGILAYNGSHRATITGCVISGYNTGGEAGRGGIQIYGSDNAVVTGNFVDSTGSTPTADSPKIRFRDALGFTCSGNYVTGLGSSGISVIALSDIGSGAGRGAITGNTVRDVSVSGIQVALGAGGQASSLYPCSISGNTIIGVRTLGANAGDAISVVAGADASAISANHIEDADGVGITSATPTTITGNTIRQVGKGSLGSKSGISITASKAVVVGNYVFDDAGTPTMTNALRVLAGATARTAGNLFENATSANVRNDGTIETQVGDINTAKVGFYGVAPIVRPTGTPAAATDAATTQALVNDLRTKLLALGLIA